MEPPTQLWPGAATGLELGLCRPKWSLWARRAVNAGGGGKGFWRGSVMGIRMVAVVGHGR